MSEEAKIFLLSFVWISLDEREKPLGESPSVDF